jgi:flavin-dependent dehydrogenase
MTIPKPDAPLRIAGAGPAGLAAAIVLARRGRAVEVREARSEVGARWRRGLQVIENFSAREDVLAAFRRLGVETTFETRPVRALTLWDARGRSARFESAEPLGYYVRRGASEGALDRGLLDQALGLGTRVVFNAPVGPGEPVDLVSTGPRRVDGLGKELTFRTDGPDRMSVILDPALAPGGYAYLFVVDGLATLGMAVLHDFRRIDAYFDRTLGRFAEIEGVRPQGGEISHSYANFFLGALRDGSGRILAGESAGFQDYLFGFGIRFAVESGALAARCLAEGVSYEELARRALRPRQMAGLWNRYLYEKGAAWVPGLFIALGRRSPDFRAYLRSWYASRVWGRWGMGLVRRSWRGRELFDLPAAAAPDREPVSA